ncbi:hypothetical protein DPMN_054881, partial [Dreissena polymorpha]
MMGGRRLYGSLVKGLLIMACCSILTTSSNSTTTEAETKTEPSTTIASTKAATTTAATTTTATTPAAATTAATTAAATTAATTTAAPTTTTQRPDYNPVNLTISNVTKTSLSISWNFKNYWKTNIDWINVTANSTLCKVDTGNTTAQCGGLTPGCSYQVTVEVGVRGLNWSNSIPTNMVPEMPGKLIRKDALAATDFTLTWNESAGCVSSYSVTVIKSNATIFNGNTPNNTIKINVPNLQHGVNYSVAIVATNGDHNSTVTEDWFRTSSSRPSEPRGLKANATGNDTIQLNWTAPLEPNGDLQHYEVCYEYKLYNDTDFEKQQCQNTSSAENSFKLQGLVSGAFYNISVKAWNDEYSGNESLIQSRTVEAEPGQVYNLSGSSTNDSVTFTWGRPLSPNGDIDEYKLVLFWLNAHFCNVILHVEAKNTSVPEPWCLTNCAANSSESSLPLEYNQKNMNVTICGLQPYTNYSAVVKARTRAGEGIYSEKSVMTKIGAPGPVRNVDVIYIESTRVTVTWDIPERNPGPVNYTAEARSVVPGINNITRTCTAQNFTSENCTITGLEEDWMYEVSVTAATSGEKSEARSLNFTTLPAAPGAVAEVKVDYFDDLTNQDNCDASKVKVTWWEPGLFDRNDYIDQYKIKYDNAPDVPFNVTDVDRYRLENRNSMTHLTGLTAEKKYDSKIFAVGKKTVGAEKDFNFTTKTCAPPPWYIKEHGTILADGSTFSSVTVTMKAAFFKNSAQGEIKSRGLIISKETAATLRTKRSIPEDNLNATTWQNAYTNNFNIPYKIYLSKNDISNGMIKVEIGSEICTGLDTEYCNGELPPSTQFWVYPFACTSVLCTVGTRFGPFATQPTPTVPPTNNGWIVGICLAIVFAAVICAFALLWYRGVINPAKWTQRFRGRRGSSDSDFEPIDDTDRSIQIAKYSEVLEELHRDTNLLLSNQYEDIKKKGAHIEAHTSSEASNLEPNKGKNRWVNILPFDHSRVKIQQLDDEDPTTDYINANYIPGFHHKREYIATQGPLPGTIDDFWRMIWEHQVKIIVMLTLCKEGQRVKCEKYWPDEVNEPKQYGEVVVNPTSMSNMDKFDINIFTLSHGE